MEQSFFCPVWQYNVVSVVYPPVVQLKWQPPHVCFGLYASVGPAAAPVAVSVGTLIPLDAWSAIAAVTPARSNTILSIAMNHILGLVINSSFFSLKVQ
jgi:hypothetical protein